MTHKEVESEVRRLCKENGIDFIFMTDEIASLSVENESKRLNAIWRELSAMIDSDTLERQYYEKLAQKRFFNEVDECKKFE